MSKKNKNENFSGTRVSERGMIIIMVMWILAILSLFAVGLGYRSSIELRLTSFYLDKTRATYLGQKALYSVFFYIANDQTKKVDAYNEPWGNSPEDFFEAKYANAKVTVSHLADGNDEKVELYGASDECGKININKVPIELLASEYWKEKFSIDDDLVEVIDHWRSKKGKNKDLDSWYETTYDYEARHGNIQILDELHFLKNFFSTSREKNHNRAKLKDIITCYGKWVNVNTATKEVLEALFALQGAKKEFAKSDRDELVRMIIEYRNGDDGLPGTEDDQLFKDVNIETAIGTHESKKITALNWLRQKKLIGVTSDFFRINVKVEFPEKKMTKRIQAVVTRSETFAKNAEGKKKKKVPAVNVIDAGDDEEIEKMRVIKYFED
ncbi:general secretion pathway protein GspK [bacterium]|nr:general secretion pathway protein GspK [bacterium]